MIVKYKFSQNFHRNIRFYEKFSDHFCVREYVLEFIRSLEILVFPETHFRGNPSFQQNSFIWAHKNIKIYVTIVKHLR